VSFLPSHLESVYFPKAVVALVVMAVVAFLL
jgi:hypothetical protein